jgi:hypothetical protein
MLVVFMDKTSEPFRGHIMQVWGQGLKETIAG